jgi:hypothetical protein
MTRSETHARIAGELAILSDEGLAVALAGAHPVGHGIGGPVATMEIGGVRLFVKCVPLTDLERRPENLRSTANLFALPTYCQYGVSSPGFGAWRELASHLMTTAWVLSGECASFPLLYHWRVMPRAAPRTLPPDEEQDVERQFAAWGGSQAIRERFTARRMASASIAIFLECLPHDLHSWLGVQIVADDAVSHAALGMVERELLEVTSFMNARGLHHFDAHFQNILTDGRRLYFSDFGQAISTRFTLSPDETEFLGRHRDFDRSYVVTRLASFVRDAPAGAAIAERYAAIAALMNDFFLRLRTASRATPYPSAELARACSDAGIRRD